MNKKKFNLSLLVSLSALILGCFVLPAHADTETFAREAVNYHSYEDAIQFQTSFVYKDNDAQSGFLPYGIWLYGRNPYQVFGYWYSTRITFYIYITAEYEITPISPPGPKTYRWDPAPDGMIEWNGWRSYDPSESTWSWRVGVSYYFTFAASHTPAADDSWGAKNSLDGDYRYIGWYRSRMSGGPHKFNSLIKLEVDNNIAEDWAEGIYHSGQYIEKVINIRIKIKVKWQYNWFGWHTLQSITHILGDNSEVYPITGNDISFIPLVAGSVP